MLVNKIQAISQGAEGRWANARLIISVVEMNRSNKHLTQNNLRQSSIVDRLAIELMLMS